jgi:hypothetical protein
MRVSERLDPNGRELRLVVIVGGEGRRKRLCHLDGGLLMEDGATIKKEGEKRRWPCSMGCTRAVANCWCMELKEHEMLETR